MQADILAWLHCHLSYAWESAGAILVKIKCTHILPKLKTKTLIYCNFNLFAGLTQRTMDPQMSHSQINSQNFSSFKILTVSSCWNTLCVCLLAGEYRDYFCRL